MKDTQFLIFEVGIECNLANCHPKCPIKERNRTGKALDDDIIIRCIQEAYNKWSFAGLIGWHFYNEPMLQYQRIFNLMENIRKLIPQSRFVLWTNGTIIPNDSRMELFEQIHVSDYFRQGDVLKNSYKGVKSLDIFVPHFDSRREDTNNNEINYNRCIRPYIEIIFDNFGEAHLCCQDWKGKIKIGNLWKDDLSDILNARNKIIGQISGMCMAPESPEFCLHCKNRIVDESVVLRFK